MTPIVSIIMGSTSDLPVMEKACKLFEENEIPFDFKQYLTTFAKYSMRIFQNSWSIFKNAWSILRNVSRLSRRPFPFK